MADSLLGLVFESDFQNQGAMEDYLLILTALDQMAQADVVALAKPSVDWNPIDHPRNHLGHFIKKGAAVFAFGKSKKATFKTPGGEVHEVEVAPGEKLLQTASGAAYKLNAAGTQTTTVHSVSGKNAVGATREVTPALKAKMLQDEWVDSSPHTEIPGATEAEALENLLALVKSAPLVTVGPGMARPLLPNQTAKVSGQYLIIQTDGAVSEVWDASVGEALSSTTWDANTPFAFALHSGGVPYDADTSAQAPAQHPVTGGAMAAPGDVLYQHSKSPNAFLVHKVSGEWTFFGSGGKESKALAQKYLADGHLGKYKKVDVSEFASSSSVDAPEAGITSWMHPVTGDIIGGPDDFVYRHKTSKTAYLVTRADGTSIFYNKSGKPASPAQALSKLKNWDLIGIPSKANTPESDLPAANTPESDLPAANTPESDLPAEPDTSQPPKVKKAPKVKPPVNPHDRWSVEVFSGDGKHSLRIPKSSTYYMSHDGTKIAVATRNPHRVVISTFDESVGPKTFYTGYPENLLSADEFIMAPVKPKAPAVTKTFGEAPEDLKFADSLYYVRSKQKTMAAEFTQSFNWGSTPEERVDLLASDDALALFSSLRDLLRPDNLSGSFNSSEKAKITKSRNRHAFMVEVVEGLRSFKGLKAKIAAGEPADVDALKALKGLLEFLADRAYGPYFGHDYPVSPYQLGQTAKDYLSEIDVFLWQAEWEKTNPPLSFDLTSEEFDSSKLEFLAAQDIVGAETLTGTQVNVVIQSLVGYPGLANHQINSAKSLISKAKIAKVANLAHVSFLKKAQTEEYLSQQSAHAEALAKSHLLARQIRLENLGAEIRSDSSIIAQWDEDAGSYQMLQGDSGPLSPESMLAFIEDTEAKGGKIVTLGPPHSGGESRAAHLLELSGDFGTHAALKHLPYGGPMNPAHAGLFKQAYVSGDSLLMRVLANPSDPWAFEGVSKDADEARLQALSDRLASYSWAPSLLAGKSFHLDSSTRMEILDALPVTSPYLAPSSTWTFPESFNLWVEVMRHRLPAPNPLTSPATVSASLGIPKGTQPEAWALVLAIESGDSEIFKALEGTEFATAGTHKSGSVGHTAGAQYVPEDVWRLYNWALSLKDPMGIPDAVLARVASGHYIPGDAPKWLASDGSQHLLGPGAKVYTQKMADGSLNYVVHPGSGIQYIVDSPAGVKTTMYGSLEGATLLYEIGADTSYSTAVAAGYTGPKDVYDAIMAVESKAPPPGSAGALSAFKSLESIDPFLKANIGLLPVSVVALLLADPSPDMQEAAAFQLKQGYFGVARSQGIFKVDTVYAHHIYSGRVLSEVIASDWSVAEKEAFAADFGLDWDEYVPENIARVIRTASAQPPEVLNSTIVLPQTLQLKPVNKSLGGMHSKKVWVDQEGNEWMTKSFPSDPASQMRVDTEHAANVLSRLFGFHAPETRIRTEGGGYEFLQHLVPAKTTFHGVSPLSLEKKQLAQAMSEHVLDWAISNHDSHSGNLLLDENGSVFGIDKGQALKFFPKDKLAVGYQPNPEPAWYDQFYNALTSGKVDQETADYIVRSVLRKAAKMEKVPDEQVRALYDRALEKRTSFPDGMDREEFIDALMVRKNSLVADFTALYEGLFAKSSLEMPDLSKLFLSQLGDVHLGVSPEFADEISELKVFGKALMVDGTAARDESLLFYTETRPSGTTLRGEMFLTESGGEQFEKWMASHDFLDPADASALMQKTQLSEAHKTLPEADKYFSTLVAAAKTVNHHSTDGAYNQTTLNALQDVLGEIESILMAISPPEEGKTSLYPGLVTAEQQDAYIAMLEEYLAAATNIFYAQSQGAKVHPHVTPFKFEPKVTAEMLESTAFTDPWPVTEYSALMGGTKIVEYSDGKKYTFYGGIQTLVGAVQLEALMGEGVGFSTKTFDPPMDSDVSESVESLTAIDQLETLGVTAKVYKRSAKVSEGSYDPKTGEFVYTHEVNDLNSNSDSEYVLDLSNGMKFVYSPLDTQSIKYKRGRLRMEAPNWSGSEKEMQDVLAVLQEIGLDVTEATPESLQVSYWRQVSQSFRGLKDTTKHDKARSAISQWEIAHPTASHEDRLAKMREEWAKVFGWEAVNAADWTPHFQASGPTTSATGGRPYWYRPDITLADLAQVYSMKIPPGHFVSGSTKSLAMSGILISSAERQRMLGGKNPGGMSPGADQGHGSALSVYARQNWADMSVRFNPRVALRLGAYAFGSDNYGAVSAKHNAPSDSGMFKFSGGGNELMIPYAVSVLSDMWGMVLKEPERGEVIAYYKTEGITEINGFPIEKFFATSTTELDAWIAQNWDALLQVEGPSFDLDA
jgi:hypothetical protein